MNITQRKPFSPGEILVAEFLEPLHITPSQLADMMKVPRSKINEIINNQQAITSDIAIRLGKVFGTSAGVWLNLQMKWDLWHAIHDEKQSVEYESIKRFEFFYRSQPELGNAFSPR
ncbi:MAG: HigA family addiction module antitoxin [Pseudomonadota bacterium]